MSKPSTIKTQMALLIKDMEYMKNSMARLESLVEDVQKNTEANFVTRAEFAPVKQIVYGLIGLLLTAVVGALISLVVRI